MTEAHIGFLYNAASLFDQNELNETHQKLKSYYLMRCKEVTTGYALFKKHFSEESRCTYCCLEWNNKAKIKLQPVKLSKRQRRRIKYNSKHKTANNEESLLCNNEIERICSFCGKSMKTPLMKPKISVKQTTQQNLTTTLNEDFSQNVIKPKNKIKKQKPDQKYQSNVYCQSKVAFSLNKQKNSIQSSIKVKPKIIKNNKKKKDKFAGLCQKAVIAATKLKQEKENENKLNLFLKPST
ncbi:unnamed protein product [Euphydryas editha]|uniref:Uncharacterized protein n=1 Tax=Euphydryas editha TaxID=104508 RepID=A0AAU9UCU2_EUPED|nr:unnamed protein product [Euphydryas editha]CAH2096998.1 unnamed protein product [Euphydryas editha]